MLRVDGKELSQLPESHPIVKIMNESRKALKGLGLPTLTIMEAKRKESKDAEGNTQHSNGCYINCVQRYQHGGVSYRIEYYDSIAYDGTKERLLPPSFEFDGMNLDLTSFSDEKIFFILFVDTQCEKIADLEVWQNEIRRPAEFALVQRERDTRERVRINREKVELEKMLYDLENDHDRLLDVCYNFGVETNQKKDYELIDTLMNVILRKDARGNYNRDTLDRFRSIVKPAEGREQEFGDLNALVGRLIDNGVVIAHGKAAGAWYLDEEKTQKLCTWNIRGDKKEALFNYLVTHRDQIPIFKEKLEQLKPA
jgi:hypothetical protein